jgi:hypothetical protein
MLRILVKHPLGKGEVDSSILSGSTKKSLHHRCFSDCCQITCQQIRAERNKKRPRKYAPNQHQMFGIGSHHGNDVRPKISVIGDAEPTIQLPNIPSREMCRKPS